MIIQDLKMIDFVEFQDSIIGGAVTKTDAKTIAEPGVAGSYADAISIGKKTYTNTKTDASVRDNDYFSSSNSSARARAKAKDEKGSSYSSDNSVSFSLTTP